MRRRRCNIKKEIKRHSLTDALITAKKHILQSLVKWAAALSSGDKLCPGFPMLPPGSTCLFQFAKRSPRLSCLPVYLPQNFQIAGFWAPASTASFPPKHFTDQVCHADTLMAFSRTQKVISSSQRNTPWSKGNWMGTKFWKIWQYIFAVSKKKYSLWVKNDK